MVGLGLRLGLSQPVVAAGGGALVNTLWPQPNFASSTGITLDGGGGTTPTISGGVLTFFDDGDPASATATSLLTLTAGTYNYSITLGSGSLSIAVGNDGNAEVSGAGTHNGQIVVTDVIGNQTIVLAAGFTAMTCSHFALAPA